MPTLIEQVERLKQQLTTADAGSRPGLLLQLAACLHWVNGAEQKQYLDILLADIGLPDLSPLRVRAELLLVGYCMNRMDLPTAWQLAQKVLADGKALQDEHLLLTVKAGVIHAAQYNGHAQQADSYMAECLQVAVQSTDVRFNYEVYSVAALHTMQHNLAEALQYAYRTMQLAEALQEQWRIGYAAFLVGHVARAISDLETEMKYFTLSTQCMKQEGAEEYYANGLLQMAIAAKDLEQYDKAEECLAGAYGMYTKLGNPRQIINTLYTYGRLYRSLKQYDTSAAYYQKAVEVAVAEGNAFEEASAYGLMGQMYRDKGDTAAAIKYLELALNTFERIGHLRNRVTMNKHLHGLYRQTGNLPKAYDALWYYTDNTLKIMDENRAREVTALQAKYEAEKREAELQKTKLQHAESELKALKAQMNPHFIFNSLNSIQEIFFLGDKQLANEHLSRFSKLMRNILKASSRQFITLQEEIEMLEEYLALEALRFGSTFTYSIRCSEAVDIYTFEIPPMILQPFVENAVKHGLQHKEGEKRLQIDFTFNNEAGLLHAAITDNGVGRAASAQINAKRKGHQSFATSALQRRFAMLNEGGQGGYAYTYTDLTDSSSQAAGTTVLVSMPVE